MKKFLVLFGLLASWAFGTYAAYVSPSVGGGELFLSIVAGFTSVFMLLMAAIMAIAILECVG